MHSILARKLALALAVSSASCADRSDATGIHSLSQNLVISESIATECQGTGTFVDSAEAIIRPAVVNEAISTSLFPAQHGWRTEAVYLRSDRQRQINARILEARNPGPDLCSTSMRAARGPVIVLIAFRTGRSSTDNQERPDQVALVCQDSSGRLISSVSDLPTRSTLDANDGATVQPDAWCEPRVLDRGGWQLAAVLSWNGQTSAEIAYAARDPVPHSGPNLKRGADHLWNTAVVDWSRPVWTLYLNVD